MTLGPAAFALIGFLAAIAAVTGVYLVTQAAGTLRRRTLRHGAGALTTSQ